MTMQEKWMRRAIDMGRKGMNQGAGGPFGAVVVRDGEIIGEGWNRVVSSLDPTAHGEMVAIRDACIREATFSLDGAEIYTSGQPCPMCLGAIHWARIGRIYYGFGHADAAEIGFGDGEILEQLALPEAARRIPATVVAREAALELIQEYAQLPTRVAY